MHAPRHLAAVSLALLFAAPASAQEYRDWSQAHVQARLGFLHKSYDVALIAANESISMAEKEVDAGRLGAVPAKLYNTRGEFFEKLNRLAEAEQDFQKAMQLAEAVRPLNDAELRTILANLADVLSQRGAVESAEQYALRALAGQAWHEGSYRDGVAPQALAVLSKIYVDSGRLGLAALALGYPIRELAAREPMFISEVEMLSIERRRVALLGTADPGPSAVRYVFKPIFAPSLAAFPGTRYKDATIVPSSCRYVSPAEARLYRLDGRVSWSVSLDEGGRVTQKRLSTSSGWKMLDDAAGEAIDTCTFVPATHAGKATSNTIDIAHVWTHTALPPDHVPPALVPGGCLKYTPFSVVPAGLMGEAVRLRFLVDTKGTPSGIKVERSGDHPSIEAAAAKAWKSCRYQPATRKGTAVASAASIRLVYEPVGNHALKRPPVQ